MNGQTAKPTMPPAATMMGSGSLYRQSKARLASPIAGVGTSQIARTARTATAPLRAPVAAAVAPCTNAFSCAFSRFRRNHGAGTIATG